MFFSGKPRKKAASSDEANARELVTRSSQEIQDLYQKLDVKAVTEGLLHTFTMTRQVESSARRKPSAALELIRHFGEILFQPEF